MATVHMAYAPAMSSDLASYLQLLLALVRTAAFAALAVYCLARAARGPWTRLGVLGGGCAATVSALYAAGLLEVIVFERFSLLQLLSHQSLSMVLDLVMTVSLLILLTAVVADRAVPALGRLSGASHEH